MLSDSCEPSPVSFAARLTRLSGLAFLEEFADGLAGFRPVEFETRDAFGVFFRVDFFPVAFVLPAFFAKVFFFFAAFFAAAFLLQVAFFFTNFLFELDFV